MEEYPGAGMYSGMHAEKIRGMVRFTAGGLRDEGVWGSQSCFGCLCLIVNVIN